MCIYVILQKELVLLRHEVLINHPGMVKLHGYFMDGEKLCVSYECNAFDSLFNLIPKGIDQSFIHNLSVLSNII